MVLNPRHCGWCGGARRPVLLAMSSGKGPTDAAREAGCARVYAQASLRGALARGCLPAVPYAQPTPQERGKRSGEARRARAALLEEVRASTARVHALVAKARELREALTTR
jgi:hypothetical protein